MQQNHHDLGSVVPRIPIVLISFTILAAVVTAPIVWVLLVDNPGGGRPVVEVEINSVVDSNTLARNLTIEENAAEGSPDDADSSELDVAPEEAPIAADDKDTGLVRVRDDMLETSQHGSIPQAAPNGELPSQFYRRPSISMDTADGKPLVAVIIGGIGLSFETSDSAIRNMPDDFTFAIAPYGKQAAEIARRARAGGHEIMLEIPLEPFDYPQNDPGPHTLLVGQSARANLDRLHWLMSRIEGYTGVINHLGAKFTSDRTDFTIVLEELALRGLSYVDDGSSSRSLAAQLAQEAYLPYAIANIQLDGNPSRSAILAQLQKLEDIARETGSAIGTADVLPVSVRTLTEWAGQLQDRGIVLVPASALLIDSTGG